MRYSCDLLKTQCDAYLKPEQKFCFVLDTLAVPWNSLYLFENFTETIDVSVFLFSHGSLFSAFLRLLL